MPSQSKSHPGRILAMLPAMVAFLCTFATLAVAQDKPAPKWELFGGYSFFYPGADVHGQLPGALFPISSRLESNPRGIGASATYNFNRWLGLTLDASHHWPAGEDTNCGVCKLLDDAGFSNLSLGPKVTFRSHRFSLFFEGLVGAHRLFPEAFHEVTKLGFMGGGGLDINLSQHFALRLIRADYVHSNYRFGAPGVTPPTEIRGVRLQTGLVFMFGGGTPPPPPPNRSPVVSCSAENSTANAGDVVAVRAQASDPDNDSLTYSWRTNGGTVEGSGPEVRWNSSGANPGTYTVRVRVDDGRGGTADCSAEIRVEPRPNRPPTMSCSADRDSVFVGEPVQITATTGDSDNDPLTFSWSTSGGRVIGSGSSVRFDTSGLRPGRYAVTGRADDGRGGAADCSVNVNVQAAPPPAAVKELEARLALRSIYFQTARPTASNPNGGLLASQQEVLSSLANDFKKYLALRPEARLILSGHADPRGTIEYNEALTERRVERAKRFLIEQGVPAASIEIRPFGEQGNLSADEVRQLIEENPDLSAEDRQEMLGNLQVIILANDRRVDVTLSTTGQESLRRYPFNAKDALALISTKGEGTVPPAKKKQ